MSARVHGNKSNRASVPKAKGQAEDQKTVFKSVLSNPYDVKWPLVPLNVQNAVLARIVAVLDGVASYSAARDRANRKRKQALRASTKDERLAKRRKTEPRADDGSDENMEDPQPSTGSRVVQDSPLDRDTFIPDATTGPNAASTDVGQPPAVLQRMYVGINEVTKRLEFQAGAMRRALVVRPDGTEPPLQPLHPISLVLVCVSDVNPPLLTAHVPFLVASCNSGRPGAGVPSVKLVPLPKGAEAVLAEATGLRRASIIAFENGATNLELLDNLLEAVPTVVAPWLALPDGKLDTNNNAYELAHIKQLRTTAPKDMKVAKDRRARGKAEAKARFQEAGIIRKKARKKAESRTVQKAAAPISDKATTSALQVRATSQKQRAKIP